MVGSFRLPANSDWNIMRSVSVRSFSSTIWGDVSLIAGRRVLPAPPIGASAHPCAPLSYGRYPHDVQRTARLPGFFSSLLNRLRSVPFSRMISARSTRAGSLMTSAPLSPPV